MYRALCRVLVSFLTRETSRRPVASPFVNRLGHAVLYAVAPGMCPVALLGFGPRDGWDA